MEMNPKFKGISYFTGPFFIPSLGLKSPKIWSSLNLGSLCQTCTLSNCRLEMPSVWMVPFTTEKDQGGNPKE